MMGQVQLRKLPRELATISVFMPRIPIMDTKLWLVWMCDGRVGVFTRDEAVPQFDREGYNIFFNC